MNVIIPRFKKCTNYKNEIIFYFVDGINTTLLKEWYDGKYTSRAIEKEVIYILYDKSGYAIDGYVIMSIV